MARRAPGSGSVYQDKHGQWWAKIPLGNGRTRRARAASAKEARETLRRWLDEQESGINLRVSRERCDRFLDRWLVGLQARQAVKPRTLEFYQRHAGYAAAEFGHVALEDLSARHWRDAQASLLKAGLSRRSVNHVQTVLGTAFAVAIADGALRANPFAAVPKLSLGDEAFEARVLSDEEITAFLAACEPERLGVLFRFILDHGVRHGEARALTWSDVQLDATDRQGQPAPYLQIRDSKSKAGRRRIPLTAAWVAILQAHRATQADERRIAERRAIELARDGGALIPRWAEHGYVFPSETGTMLNEQNVVRTKQRILQRAGLCDPCLACQQSGQVEDARCAACHGRGVILWRIRIHDLRHTAITDWIADGASPKAAQALAGHSDPSITMRVYAKSRERMERETLERTEAARQRRRKPS